MKKLAVLAVLFLLTGCEPPDTDTGDPEASEAVDRSNRGEVIGTVTSVGELAILELDEGVIAEANLFDLEGRTLRFTPVEGGYQVENLPLEWDAEYGAEVEDGAVPFEGFEFPSRGGRGPPRPWGQGRWPSWRGRGRTLLRGPIRRDAHGRGRPRPHRAGRQRLPQAAEPGSEAPEGVG
jgi:hypothetical protein